MSELLLFSERLPLALGIRRLILPLLADDLGNFRICKAWMVCNYLSLIVLTI
jgi:hypothetical protein